MIDYDTEHDWQWPNPKKVRWVMPMKGYQAAISVGALEGLLESTLPISKLAPGHVQLSNYRESRCAA